MLADYARKGGNHPLAILWVRTDIAQPADHPQQNQQALPDLIGQCLPQQTGDHAQWCRMAPDEFVCLLHDHDFDRVNQLAATLLAQLREPLMPDDYPHRTGTSIGIALMDMNETAYACLERAEQAMHSARRGGGSRIVISGTEPVPGRMGIPLARHELELEHRLHQVLDRGGLSLDYQPCVDIHGNVLSVEALLRCAEPETAIGDTLPIAEKTGLIVRLGEWSLLEGARMARRLANNGMALPVSINVSRAQFAAPNFSRTLHAALMCANINPALFELELNESLLFDHSRTVQANLRAVQEAGIRMVIDDFGGQACLTNLKNLSSNKIKLDRKFVASLPYDRRALSVLAAIARLGAEFGMQVVAKGVENTAQLDSLHQVGIYVTQGYLHAHPMPEAELKAWLKKQGEGT